MQEVLNATEVRKDWGRFIDNVVHSKPSVVKRNRDYIAALSLEHLDLILAPYRFKIECAIEEDGSVSGSFKELDLVANAPTLDELKKVLAQELVEYAEDYMSEFNKFYNAPNRRNHFPYITRVLIQNDIDSILKLIDA